MKRNGPTHPKTLWLRSGLKLSKYEVVGLLEMFWHFVARTAPQGDIGKWTDEQIAEGVEWRGDASELVRNLVDSGFVDEDRKCRLIVHDWEEHADGALKKTLQRAGLAFVKPADKRRTNGRQTASARPTSEGDKRPTAVPCLTPPHPTQPDPIVAPPTGAAPTLPEVVRPQPWNQLAVGHWIRLMGPIQPESAMASRITKQLTPVVKEHLWRVVEPLWVEALEDAVASPCPEAFVPESFVRAFHARLAKSMGQARASPAAREKARGTMASTSAAIREISSPILEAMRHDRSSVGRGGGAVGLELARRGQDGGAESAPGGDDAGEARPPDRPAVELRRPKGAQ